MGSFPETPIDAKYFGVTFSNSLRTWGTHSTNLVIHVRKTSQLWTTTFAEYLENYFISWILNELELDQEEAWPRGQCSRLTFRRSQYWVSLWPLPGFVLSWSKFKSSATLVKTAPYQLGFLILLCCILLISNYREISDLGLNVLTSRTDKVNKLFIIWPFHYGPEPVINQNQ